MSVVCCQVQVSAKDRTLFQRSPTERGASESDCKASIISPLGLVAPWGLGEIVWVTQSDE